MPPTTGPGADPGLQPVGLPTPEPPAASVGGADPGADPGDGLSPSLQGSGATTNASDARRMVATQLAETLGPPMKAGRTAASAAIDYLRAQLAGAIPRIDPPPPSTPREHGSAPGTLRKRWTMAPATGHNKPAGVIKLERIEQGPGGGIRPTPEASPHQLASPQMTAGANLPQSERPGSSGTNPGPATGLGSAAQILIPIGLAAAVCGFAAPAFRRRLSLRAGWLRSALLASPLEQPG